MRDSVDEVDVHTLTPIGGSARQRSDGVDDATVPADEAARVARSAGDVDSDASATSLHGRREGIGLLHQVSRDEVHQLDGHRRQAPAATRDL